MESPCALDDRLAACGQITPADVAALAAAGYRAVINTRPDAEAPGQPTSAALAAAAQAAGLAYHHIPVKLSAIADRDVERFRAALNDAPGPVLAFCRTGTRAAALWALALADCRPATELLERASAAGFDLSEVRARIEAAEPGR